MIKKTALAVFALAGWCHCLPAQEVPETELSGKVVTFIWDDLGSTTWPNHQADTKAWPAPIPSTPPGLEYQKISGTGYATKGGIYAGGADYTGPLQEKILSGKVNKEDLSLLKAEDFKNVGRFQISAPQVLPGLRTVVFEIRLKGFPPGEWYTPFELTQHVFPVTLSYNGGEQKLRPSSGKVVKVDFSGGFPEEIYEVRWDLPVNQEEVKSFVIHWAVYPHALTAGLRVSQSAGNTDSPAVVE